MPELPDVENARRFTERALKGRRIERVSTVNDPIVYEGVTPRRFARALAGRRVLAVRRKGKQLWMVLDLPPFPLFHFDKDQAGNGTHQVRGVRNLYHRLVETDLW